jgi:hypothetical protein
MERVSRAAKEESLIRTYRRTLCLAVALILSAASRAQQPAPPTPATQTPASPATTPQAPAPQTPGTPTPPAPDPAKLAADTAKQHAQAEQALAFLLKHEVLDPSALVPGTGKPLPPNGKWSVGKDRPPTCPAAADNCVRILYRVPATTVSCEWVVMVKPGGAAGTTGPSGTILEQNLDATRYLLRFVPPSEAAPLIMSRAKPLPVSSVGTVEIGVIVGTTGEPTRVTPLSGPNDLRAIALPEANAWLFKPLQVGGRTIPYQTNIKFIFANRKVTTEP